MEMANESTQNIPQEATKLKKLAKVTARYMEMEQFIDSDHHTSPSHISVTIAYIL